MHQHNALRPTLFFAPCSMFLCGIVMAQATTLPLRKGSYVVQNVPCKDAPFAALRTWDGKAFSGPHSSQCTSHVVSRGKGRYTVSTSCAALGDGTPDTTGYVEALDLQLLSGSRFLIRTPDGTKTSFRRCPVAPYR